MKGVTRIKDVYRNVDVQLTEPAKKLINPSKVPGVVRILADLAYACCANSVWAGVRYGQLEVRLFNRSGLLCTERIPVKE